MFTNKYTDSDIVLNSNVMPAFVFAGMSQKVIGLLGLVPSVLCEYTSTDLMTAVDVYRACLQCLSLICWKQNCSDTSSNMLSNLRKTDQLRVLQT